MEYVRRIPTVHAIQFQYTKEGIREMVDFCGEELKQYGINSYLFDKGWAWIGNTRRVAVAGDYLVKENGLIQVYKEADFNKLFLLVSGG